MIDMLLDRFIKFGSLGMTAFCLISWYGVFRETDVIANPYAIAFIGWSLAALCIARGSR